MKVLHVWYETFHQVSGTFIMAHFIMHFVCISLDEQRNITYITGAVAIVFTEDIFAPDLYIDMKLPLD